MGPRSTGKTYAFSFRCAKDFITKKRRFIWMRQTQEDIKRIYSTWQSNIITNSFFEGHTIDTDEHTITIDGEMAGMFIPASLAKKYKSVAFPDVDYIIYDEFLPENLRYLGGEKNPMFEPDSVVNLLQTVSRGPGQPYRPCRLVLLANKISLVNPYFTYFGIDSLVHPGMKKLETHGVYAEFFENTGIVSEVMKSPLGEVLANTPMAAYHADKEFMMDSKAFICERPKSGGVYIANLIYQGTSYAVWQYSERGYYFITTKGIDKCRSNIAMTGEDHNTNYIMLTAYKDFFKRLKGMYSNSAVRFEDLRSKKFFESVVMGL